MNYIYGDATDAPFRVDYIALLRATIEYGVEHLLCEQRRHALDGKTLSLRSSADAEIRRIEELGRAVAKALEESLGSDSAAVTACAQAIVGASSAQVQASVERVRAQLARDLNALAEQEQAERERSLVALGGLLAKHDLPDTSFSLKLSQQGGTHYAGRVSTRSGLGLDAELALEIPKNARTPFASMVRVERFAPGLELHVPEASGWFSKSTTMKPYPADKLYVMEVAIGEGGSFKLRTGLQGTGAGWDAKIGKGGEVELVYWNDKGEQVPVEPHGDDGKKVKALFEHLSAAASEARFEGAKLLEATLDGDPYVEHEEPTVLIERLVDEIAPGVQEIARRSKSSEELVIKRVTGDSRREEIFVSKAELVARLAEVPLKVRGLFASLGLEEAKPASRPPPELKNPSRPPPPVPAVESAAEAPGEQAPASAVVEAPKDAAEAPAEPEPRTSATPAVPAKGASGGAKLPQGRPSAPMPPLKRGKA